MSAYIPTTEGVWRTYNAQMHTTDETLSICSGLRAVMDAHHTATDEEKKIVVQWFVSRYFPKIKESA